MENEVSTRNGLRIGSLRSAADVAEGGLFATWFGLGLGFAENVVRVSHGVVQEWRSEIADGVRDTISWGEGRAASGLRGVRVFVDGFDALARDAMQRAERGAVGGIGTIDRTAAEVRTATTRTVAHVVGDGTERVQPS